MKRVLYGLAAAFVLVGLVAGLLVSRALRRLGTPEFRREVLAEAKAALGTDVEARSLEVSVLKGFRLKGLRIRNPAPFAGDLLTAESANLGYDLWPLLRGRVQIDELSLDKPVIRIVGDGRGFNYERLKPYASPGARSSSSAAGSAFLRELVVEKLAVTDAAFSMAEGRQTFLRVEDFDFQSRITLGAESGGKGEARIATAVLAEALFLRGVRAPIVVSKSGLRLEPLEARLADGSVKGKIRVDLAPDLRWSLDLAVAGASMETLRKEAGAPPTLTGTLEAGAALAGSGGMPTARGKGQAQIRDCRFLEHPVTKTLAAVLQLPELASPRFDECVVEFDVAAGVARTPLRFKGKTLEVTGRGTYGLATSTIDYDLTLALGPELLARIPGNTTRAAFKKREDGFGTLDFGVTGTASDPKVDLVQRLGASLAREGLKEGIRKLFRKKSN